MNILFTICGRAGSKGIKNKNIRNLLDKPLVYWTISAIDLFVKSQSFIKDFHFDVSLNTDSKELQKLVNDNKMLSISLVKRKAELAGDVVGKIDVVRDTYFQMQEIMNIKYDLVIDLDITSPLRTKYDIENLIKKYIDTLPDVVFSVTESRRNPYFNMVQRNSNGKIVKVINSNFTSRQQAPRIYDLNASLYAYSPSFLDRRIQIFDGINEIIEMKDTAVLDLDKIEDFEYMEVIASYLINSSVDFKEIYSNIK